MRYFEDFAVGDEFDLGRRTVSRDEMLAFARSYDPQVFHVDEERAAHGPFGGIIASGIHTAAVHMRMYVDNVLNSSACMGSPGIEDIRFPAPVRPGDTLSATLRVLEVADTEFRPDRGRVLLQSEVRNQRGQVVMLMRSHVLFGRRSAGS